MFISLFLSALKAYNFLDIFQNFREKKGAAT